MKLILVLTVGLIGLNSGSLVASANAKDASWGCQVLLCAASQNPSWQGVSYCVPPMTRLIAAMVKPGFSWPVCHEANAGKPGHQIYDDCPAGTTIGYSVRGNHGASRVPNLCVETINACQVGKDHVINTKPETRRVIRRSGGGGNSCIQKISTPRPQRKDPWFFDIPNDKGIKKRFWFNLNY